MPETPESFSSEILSSSDSKIRSMESALAGINFLSPDAQKAALSWVKSALMGLEKKKSDLQNLGVQGSYRLETISDLRNKYDEALRNAGLSDDQVEAATIFPAAEKESEVNENLPIVANSDLANFGALVEAAYEPEQNVVDEEQPIKSKQHALEGNESTIPFDEPEVPQGPPIPFDADSPPSPPPKGPDGTTPAATPRPEKEKGDIATKIFLEFITGSYVGIPDSWKGLGNEKWKEVAPQQICAAIFDHIYKNVFLRDTKGTSAFMTVNPLGEPIQGMGETATIGKLIESFQAAGHLFPKESKRVEEHLRLGIELGDNLSTIQQIFSRGDVVHKFEEKPDELKKFYADSENRMNIDDWQKIAKLGSEFAVDPETGKEVLSFGERVLYAMQAHFFINQVRYIPEAVWNVSLKPGEEPKFSFNIREKNPLTIFPSATGDVNYADLVRMLIQKEVGSATMENRPAWVKWQEENPRRPGEYLVEYLDRLTEFGKQYFKQKLFGNGTKEDPSPDSEYGKYKALSKGGAIRASSGQHLTEVEKDQYIPAGLIPEMAAFNIHEYSLLPCTAEGDSLTGEVALFEIYETEEDKYEAGEIQRISRQLKKGLGFSVGSAEKRKVKKMRLKRVYSKDEIKNGQMPPRESMDPNEVRYYVVNVSKSKPTSVFQYAKLMSPTSYALGLTYSDEKSSGSDFIAPPAVGKLFATILDQYQTYVHIPDGERVGITLGDELMLAKNQEDFKNIPFSKLLEKGESNPEWFDLLDYGYKRYKTFVEGLGDLSKITSVDVLAGSAFVSADPDVVRNKFSPLLRSLGDYSSTRKADWGWIDRKTSFKSMEEYRQFRVIEDWYLEECNRARVEGRDISTIEFPPQISGVETEPLKEKVIDGSRFLSKHHSYFDIPDSSDTETDVSKRGIVRWQSRFKDAVYIPDPEKGMPMNPFEREVMSNEYNSALTKAEKIHFGDAMIVALYLSRRRSFTLKDRKAIKVALSRESSESLAGIRNNWFYNFLVGSAENPDSIKIFTDVEVEAMMDVAQVAGGMLALSGDIQEFFRDVKAK